MCTDEMNREATRRMPRLPELEGKQPRQRKENIANRKTNATLEAVSQMDTGRLDFTSLLQPSSGSGELDPEDPLARRVLEIREVHRRRMNDEEASVEPARALERILKVPAPEVSEVTEILDVGPPSRGVELVKGEIASCSDPEDVGLPEI